MRCVPHATSLRRAPVQQRSAERLTRILDACADLLDEAGYEALSTRSVAVRAGVPIGSVYRFFGNKRAMVDALAQRNLERYTERVRERLGGGGTAAAAAGAAPGPSVPSPEPAAGAGAGPESGGDWRAAMDAVLDEYLAMKRTAPGFSLVDFGNQIPLGSRHAEPNHRVADLLADLLSGHLNREPDAELRRVFLVAVETADTLVQLAFRVDPEGDEGVIEETRTLLRAYLGRVLD
ncbi:TetR/AcrR family transcriptional regulator [Streptomyces tropicalis]|uniref:TetR/AcrR family transcriptional regulator n=1 Tax=Streptomyces tropicalis TaxID=3034234 RepID=A0ABT6A5N8_9ACTN|nr:TetR/AcrR family transcriptional regulator [Streptomyces tropicalis]MDF3299950.1 TetR/AcrR family transcriptional regulator [Streptomyces tropicalis]